MIHFYIVHCGAKKLYRFIFATTLLKRFTVKWLWAHNYLLR